MNLKSGPLSARGDRDDPHKGRPDQHEHHLCVKGSRLRGLAWTAVDAKHRALMPRARLHVERVKVLRLFTTSNASHMFLRR
jgi:hypothetical protein